MIQVACKLSLVIYELFGRKPGNQVRIIAANISLETLCIMFYPETYKGTEKKNNFIF